jgi:hypothetical protein
MEQIKSTTLKLKTRTLLTFENRGVKREGMALDTDPTTSTFPTTSAIFSPELFRNSQKKG